MWLFSFILLIAFVAFLFAISVGIALLIGDKKYTITKIVFVLFALFVVICIIIVSINNYFTEKMHVSQQDIYGNYVIDRTMFPGENADWQYNHFRIEITQNDSIKLYVTDAEKIKETHASKIEFTLDNSPHIRIIADSLQHAILKENPTLYRKPFSFYYVFQSPLYGNMFFTKGEYKAID